MDRQTIYKALMLSSKEDIADALASVLNLLTHRIEGKEEYNPYLAGWNDSRDIILMLCKIELERLCGIDVQQ